jgi:hypothetical protein
MAYGHQEAVRLPTNLVVVSTIDSRWRNKTRRNLLDRLCSYDTMGALSTGGNSLAKRCSWILVNCTLASPEFVTMRQLIIPSETDSLMACRRRACTTPGGAVSSACAGGLPKISESAASLTTLRVAGGVLTVSAAHRLINRSRLAPAF